MRESVKLLGHPVHPMLVVFPLGLLATSVIFDIVHFATGRVEFANVSFWMIAAGLIGGLCAAVFGLLDWTTIPKGTRAAAVGTWHGVTNLVVVILFAISWFLRLAPHSHGAGVGAGPFVLSVIGLACALVSGWLGGELVDRLGIGVDPNADPNAPSSLGEQRASVMGPWTRTPKPSA